MGRHTHMLLACAGDALREGGCGVGEIGGEEIAFFAGMDAVDPEEGDLAAAVAASRGAEGGVGLPEFFAEGLGRIPPLWPLGMLNAMGFCQVAIQFGLRGENAVFSPGAEAGAQAVAEAADALRAGRARAALAAGVSAVVSARAVARHRGQGLLPPGAGGRPFAGGEGAALGEGAGVLLLEPPEAARARGRQVRGRVRSWGSARALDDPGGLARAIRAAADAALRAGGVEADEVGLVLPHAEGGREGDRAEVEALSALFEGRRPLALATKGAFGHLLGGAPAVDLALALRALEEGVVPPSPGAGRGAEGVLRFPARPERAGGLRFALVLCRGFGGTCSAFLAESA